MNIFSLFYINEFVLSLWSITNTWGNNTNKLIRSHNNATCTEIVGSHTTQMLPTDYIIDRNIII